MYIFQVHHYIKPDQIEAYKAATLENASKTLQEPGVLRFDVFQDATNPVISVYWKSTPTSESATLTWKPSISKNGLMFICGHRITKAAGMNSLHFFQKQAFGKRNSQLFTAFHIGFVQPGQI